MTLPITLPEQYKIIAATSGPRTTNGGITCDYISLKYAHKVWIVAQCRQAASHATTIQPRVATDVSGTSVKNSAAVQEWWKNADVDSSDSLVQQTAAALATLTTGTTNQLVVIEIDPSRIVEADGDGFDCLGCVVSDSSQATNFMSINYIVEQRYPGIPNRSPSMIID